MESSGSSSEEELVVPTKRKMPAMTENLTFLSAQEREQKKEAQKAQEEMQRLANLRGSFSGVSMQEPSVVEPTPEAEPMEKAEPKLPSRPRALPKGRFQFEWGDEDDTSGGQELAPEVYEAARAMCTSNSKRSRTDTPAAVSDLADDETSKHWSEKPLSEMTERDWRILAEDYSISVSHRGGGTIPHPLRSWEESGLPTPLLKVLEGLRFVEPTPIQRIAIPCGLEKRDLVGLAQTGSGKTLAFVLPLLMQLRQLPALTAESLLDGPYALILAPTRELVMQIEDEARRFTSALRMRSVSLVGGLAIEEQAAQLRKGCELLVATPGRLLDCLNQRYVVLNQCHAVVLDEADKMIDMGFEEQVDAVLKSMAPVAQRTTFMFSATMPPAAEQLAKRYFRRPLRVSVGQTGVTVDRIRQSVEWLSSEASKKPRLLAWLAGSARPQPPIIVFCNQKRVCDDVCAALVEMRYAAAVLHSGKAQSQREQAIAGFRTGKIQYLVATDVAARGIDIKGVRWVVNYDLPTTVESYVHRIGRTGRAGADGNALSFATNADADVLPGLKNLLSQVGARIPSEILHHPSVQNATSRWTNR